jgi:hypothetical protein
MLAHYQAKQAAMSGVRMGPNGCKISPRTPLYRRVDLSHIDEWTAVPGERTEFEVKARMLQQVLLLMLAALAGTVAALVR